MRHSSIFIRLLIIAAAAAVLGCAGPADRPASSPVPSATLPRSIQADARERHFGEPRLLSTGSGLEQVTFSGGFDGFPMFAPDGETFVFCSNRRNSKPGETNVFVTTWVD